MSFPTGERVNPHKSVKLYYCSAWERVLVRAFGQELPGTWPGKEFSLLFFCLGPWDFSTSHTGTVLGNPKVQGSEGRGLRTEREGIGKSQHEQALGSPKCVGEAAAGK